MLRVAVLDPEIAVRPGTTVPCVVRVHNDGAIAVKLSMRVVGLGPGESPLPVPWQPLLPGESLDVEVDVAVPEAMVAGDHEVAVEVGMVPAPVEPDGLPRSRPGRKPIKPTVAMAPLMVRVGSLDQVVLRTNPTVLRGRFGKRFEVEVINTRHLPVTVDVDATSPHLDVAIDRQSVVVAPGATEVLHAAVHGRRHWVGGERQHIINVEGKGSATPTYTRLVYRQRPILARGVRGAMAALVLLGLWAGILGGGVYWFTHRDDKAAPAAGALVDTNGDGIPDKPGTGTGTGTGDGTGTDGSGGSDGDAGGDAPGAGEKAAQAPTSTVLRGVVKAGKTGDDGGVVVTMTPLVAGLAAETPTDGGAQPAVSAPGSSAAALLGGNDSFAAAGLFGLLAGALHAGVSDAPIPSGGKFWSARYGDYTGTTLLANRGTVSVPVSSGTDGSWLISDVPLRRTYEVSFSKPGFDRKSFVVTPTDDGKPVELNVDLQPGKGALGGIITGGGAPLGGVALTITDGTLTYSTTTSTDAASLGRWSVDGLGTPATYSITAVLDGYGTAIAQVSLGAGEQQTKLAFNMTAGAGSIGGVIRGADGPLGGITLTAAGAGVTRTATSLTAGAIGSYLFPDLDIPAAYTITASAPGYITQTRLVQAGGNVTGIDIEMTRTTATVVGRVMSVRGATTIGQETAAVEMMVDGLPVRTMTAVGPVPGSFTLPNLPPGTYTISFSRYDHVPDSRLITLTAGQRLDLGEVPLQYRPREQLNPIGTVSVSVIDTAQQPLDKATIRLVDVGRTIATRQQTLGVGETSFQFTNVPIGTYTVEVSRSDYRPFSLPRLSVGLGDRPVTATMLKFGQAFGQVIDGLAPQITVQSHLTSSLPLDDYRMLVYEATQSGLTCVGTVRKGPGESPDAEGKIRWEVGLELQLLSGTYVLRFAPIANETNPTCSGGGKLPNGYAANPDGNGNVGTFVIPPDGDAPIQVADIAVFPYPHISGVVLAPKYNSSTGAVDLVPATTLANSLTVSLRCGAATTPALLSVVSNVVTFDISRTTVAGMFPARTVPSGNSLGPCSVVASANGFVTVDTALPTEPTIPTTGGYDDRALAVVLADKPDVLQGTTYWVDRGNSTIHPITSAQISASNVIVGFGVGQGVDTDGDGTVPVTPGTPPPVLANLSTFSVSGTVMWSFANPGASQVAGQSTYVANATSYLPGSFVLRVEDNGRTVVSSSGFANPVVDGSSLSLEMVPVAGSINGGVRVLTGSSVDRRDEALVVAIPPGGVATDVPVHGAQYSINPAAAGTWQLDYRSVPGSNLVPAPGQTAATQFVAPAETVAMPVADYWDLAAVDVSLEDTNHDPIAAYTTRSGTFPSVAFAQSPPVVSYPLWVDRTVVADAGHAMFDRLSVDTVDPTNTLVHYTFGVTAPGYEIDTATYEVFEDGGTTPIASGTDVTTISVDVKAGTRLQVKIVLPSFGAISGTVRGLLRPPSTAAADVELLDMANGLSVTYQHVADALGTPLDPLPPVLNATPVPGAVPGYTIAVPQGFYAVTFVDGDFDSRTVVFTVGIGEQVNGNVDLDIGRGSFELSVITDSVSNNPVGAANVKLWPAGTLIADTAHVTPSYTGLTDAAGFVDFDPTTSSGIIPGAYLVIVRKADASNPFRDGFFPVIANITIPRGTSLATRTVVRKAVMPQTNGSLVGSIKGQNTAGDPVPLPASITVARTFHVPQAGGPDSLPNIATEGNQVAVPTASVTVSSLPAATTAGYTFVNLAGGVHTLSFSTASGYQPITDFDVTADQVGPTSVADVIYVAQNVTWRVTLSAGNVAVTGQVVQATAPGGGLLTATETATPGTYEFTDVLPQTTAYHLVLNPTYYRVTTPSLDVLISPTGSVVTTPLTLVPRAIITGTATKQLTASTTAPVTEANSVELLKASDSSVLATTTPDSAGGYQFLVESTQGVRVRVTVAGFKGATVNPGAITFGTTITAPTATVKALAGATITVTGPASPSVIITPSAGTSVTSAAGVFTFTGLDPDQTYVFTASAAGYLSQTVPSTGVHDPAVGGSFAATVALETARTIDGTVTKGATGVSGAKVHLMNGATEVATVQSDPDGSYTFSGLGYGTYTVTADKFRTGAGTTAAIPVVVGGSTTITGADIALTARDVTVTFSVTSSRGVPNPTITINAFTGPLGQLVFAVPEDGSFSYTVSALGYIDKPGNVTLGTTYSATVAEAVSITANSVAGTVTGSIGANSVVVLCGSANMATAAACAADNTRTSAPVSGGSRGFTFRIVAPGTYGLVVMTPASGSNPVAYSTVVTVTVAADGTVSPASASLAAP